MAHVLYFAGWLVTQSGIVPLVPIFDPLPFTILTLVVSLEAIFLSIFIPITQRHGRRNCSATSIVKSTYWPSKNRPKLSNWCTQLLEVPDLPSDETLSADTSVRFDLWRTS